MPELTTIDIAALFDDAPAARAAVDRAILTAVKPEGGFVVAGFPGAADLDARTRKLLNVFDLPADATRAVATRASTARTRARESRARLVPRRTRFSRPGC